MCFGSWNPGRGATADAFVVGVTPGTFMLLTGSNMAGKSTLLRAIGFNAIFARTGAAACALQMTVDFILRPGVATTTNAISLLRHVGLADENEP